MNSMTPIEVEAYSHLTPLEQMGLRWSGILVFPVLVPVVHLDAVGELKWGNLLR